MTSYEELMQAAAALKAAGDASSSVSGATPTPTLVKDYSAFSAYLGKSEFIDMAMLDKDYLAMVEAEGAEEAKRLMLAVFKLQPKRLVSRRKFQDDVVGARPLSADGVTRIDLISWERYSKHFGLPADYQGANGAPSTTKVVDKF